MSNTFSTLPFLPGSSLSPKYIVQRFEYGWLVLPPPGQAGIPMEALKELTGLASKKAVMAPGVANFYDAMLAIAEPKDVKIWETIIEEYLKDHEPHPGKRWLRGTDTGLSSRAIFIALIGDTGLQNQAATSYYDPKDFAQHTPRDADDFGRCHRLLLRTPPWEAELHKVAEFYPGSKWEKIIPEWANLVKLFMEDKEALTKRLQELNT